MISGYHVLGATMSPPVEDVPVLRSEGEARDAVVRAARGLIGVPYIWASKDPGKGLDCSGFATVCYERAGLARPGARYKYGSADLKRALEPVSTPSPADAVFYGSGGKVSHVMLYLGNDKVIGATGGGRSTTSVSAANEAGAYVKEKPLHYRKDLIGFGRAPSPSAPLSGSSRTVLETSDELEDRAVRWGAGITITALLGAGAYGVYWLYGRRS